MRWIVIVCCLVIGAGVYLSTQPDEHASHDAMAVSAGITIPDLAGDAARGLDVFAANCVSCHGAHATGTDSGPSLVHIIYEPSHHGDGAFYAAVRNGVRQHHWPFGDMPPVPGVTDEETGFVIAYIRTLQRANAIN